MNKKFKKVLAIVLATVFICGMLAGCSSDTSTDDTTDATVYSIGILQLVQHDALDSATEGFKQALIDILGEENVEFDEQNASGDTDTCATIAAQFVTDEVDLIFANATGAVSASAAATDTIPIVGTSVTDYATALDMDEWDGVTGINVTGTSDLPPLDEQAAMIEELFGADITVGLLYCSAEANSQYQVTTIEGYLDELGIAYEEYPAADSNEVASVVTTACDEVDVIYVPTDNTMASCTETINNVAEPAGIPIVAGEEGICEGCGVATLSIDYYDLGYAAGEMAAEILTEGSDPATMEIQYASELTKEYMADRAETLGVTIPDDYTAIVVDEDE